MKPATLARLAVAGNRTDHLRTALTAISAALAVVVLLCAATVFTIHGGDEYVTENGESLRTPGANYSSALLAEAGLRPGVGIALILLALPVLALAGQCIRLGAPARDRRLAAIRLAGATPGEAVLIAGAETVMAGVLGSIGGLGIFLLLRVLLERRNAEGQLLLPADVLPPVLVIVVLLALVPVLAGLVGALLLRRVVISPLGVVRRTREDGPLPWPGFLIFAGLVLFQAAESVKWINNDVNRVATAIGSGILLVMLGVVLGTGWITHTTGRLLQRHGRRPAMLLAGRRLMADPWSGSRTLAALLASVVFGAIALGYRTELSTQAEAYRRLNALTGNEGSGLGGSEGFYTGAVDLVMVAIGIGVTVAAAGMLVSLAEGIVARRRAYAALTAVGVPKKTLSESVLWQSLLPLIPALALALVAGAGIARLSGSEVAAGQVRLAVPVPLERLALLGAGAFLAMLVATAIGLLVLRSSTEVEELRAG
ncbi:FtsX-like permease family protein [Actinoplanes sp. TFC3]|uniref:FtsX-like permease family protein n=1 Tax=Actinoplanes sp. TFC3 TaxID=1710355 RepID=UPI000833992C|nr:FtsX-like permease family protein [Actinoplanes sp. TFC3]